MTDASPLPPHSRRSAETWAAARAAYEAGASIRIVAERHGLNIRTVSRHARTEGWVAPRIPAAEAWAEARSARAYNPEAFTERVAIEHVLQGDDETLLLRPDSLGLCGYAFRRAAECASVSGPTEALAWIRLAEATARLRRQVDVDVRPMSEIDYRRVAALAREETHAHVAAFRAAPPEEPAAAEVSEVSESVP